MKKGKIISLVIASIILISSIAIYFSAKSDFSISIGKPVDSTTPMYVENVRISYNEEPSESDKENLTQFVGGVETIEKEINSNYIAPTHIEATVEFEDGKTIIRYNGTATEKDTSKEVEYNEEIVFDFILTKDVTEN